MEDTGGVVETIGTGTWGNTDGRIWSSGKLSRKFQPLCIKRVNTPPIHLVWKELYSPVSPAL